MMSEPIAFDVFNEIGIIDQLASAMFSQALPKGMTIAQFTVLNHFVRLGIAEKSPAALASAFQLTRATMTSTLTRMERAGLIVIRLNPEDGRAKLVSLTETGRMMRAKCIAAITPLAPGVAAAVPESEMTAILPLLRAMRIALDAMRDKAKQAVANPSPKAHQDQSKPAPRPSP